MWPSGEVRVCKTLDGGSNPPMTSDIITEKDVKILDFWLDLSFVLLNTPGWMARGILVFNGFLISETARNLQFT